MNLLPFEEGDAEVTRMTGSQVVDAQKGGLLNAVLDFIRKGNALADGVASNMMGGNSGLPKLSRPQGNEIT